MNDSVQDAVIVDGSKTLRELIPGFIRANHLANTRAATWHLGIGHLGIQLPNFEWRKRAIDKHDAHHLLLGYPCTPTGEMQMAAWEFSAGRFPHPGATLFCLPLVAIGAVLVPRQTFLAFIRGRRGTTLYSTDLSEEILSIPVNELQQRFTPSAPERATAMDWFAYIRLVGLSFVLIVVPLLLLALVLIAGFR